MTSFPGIAEVADVIAGRSYIQWMEQPISNIFSQYVGEWNYAVYAKPSNDHV